MKIGKNGFFHLTYCSNIHPGETWVEVSNNIKKYVPVLKTHFAPNNPFGIGLRLSNQAANELLQGSELANFKNWLIENQCYVFTINGFPYGGFHHTRVKEEVYAPDWLTTARRDYCLNLVKILAELTPPHGESGFSTTPLSYKPWVETSDEKEII